jgi:CheY-like chemotaxis protein
LICDATGGLTSQLPAYADLVESVVLDDLADLEGELARCPAHAVLVNAGGQDELLPLLARAQARSTDTPVVGCALPRGLDRALEAGATGYLIKPVSQAVLVQALEALGRPVERVLIVDDDPQVVRLFARMLRAHDPELSILTACSGTEALARAVEGGIDLMLLDVVMAGMDGWEVLRALRRACDTVDLPVLLVSAQDVLERPAESELLAVAPGHGLPAGQILRCTLALSELLLTPAGGRGSAPRPGGEA